MSCKVNYLAIAIAAALPLTGAYADGPAHCDDKVCDDYIVVTGEVMREPTKVSSDPKSRDYLYRPMTVLAF